MASCLIYVQESASRGATDSNETGSTFGRCDFDKMRFSVSFTHQTQVSQVFGAGFFFVTTLSADTEATCTVVYLHMSPGHKRKFRFVL